MTEQWLGSRGHVTNASFKQWEIWEETHLRETFYGNLIFQQSSMICILLPSNMAAKTTFCLYLVKRFIVTLKGDENVTA